MNSELEMHKMTLELIAGRRSGMTSRTEQRDAAAAILDVLESAAAELARARECIDKVRVWLKGHDLGMHGCQHVHAFDILNNYEKGSSDV